MKILFLGTGTSTGVPSMCCDCEVCRSEDPKNKRLRASILVSENGQNILVDTSTDLRQQCLTHRIQNVHHVLFDHYERSCLKRLKIVVESSLGHENSTRLGSR